MIRHAVALAGAAALAVALPWFALTRSPPTPLPRRAVDDRPLRAIPAVSLDAVIVRDPFQSGGMGSVSADDPPVSGGGDTEGPPQIVGIAGRLPDRAIVLVRQPEGGTRTLAVGEAIGRWRLVSIGADAALFVDGARRARVELPPADPAQ